MTDRELFEIKEFFAIYDKLEGYSDSDKSIALAAWQARGELERLKSTPPSREWVGLSNDEIDAIFPLGDDVDVLDVARGIEAKLKELNG